MNEKKKSRKSLLVFVLILLCAMVVGFAMGFASTILTHEKDIPEMFRLFFADHAFVIIALCLIAAVLQNVYLLYAWMKMRRMEKTIDMEADDATDEIDRLFAKAGTVMNVGNVLEMLFMAVTSYCMHQTKAPAAFLWETLILCLLMALLLTSVFPYRGMVSIIKRLNPEKQGDALHVLFHREWERSSDEAQKKIIYESGYRAYTVMTITGIIVELIAITAMFTFETGLFPCILIGVILIVGQFWFSHMQYKMEEQARNTHKGGKE